jgi:hypothetical protein
MNEIFCRCKKRRNAASYMHGEITQGEDCQTLPLARMTTEERLLALIG